MPKLDETIGKESPGLFWLSGFQGINQHDDRRAIDDEECYWLENLAPLGAANARAMFDVDAPLYTASLIELGLLLFVITFIVLACAQVMLRRLDRGKGK